MASQGEGSRKRTEERQLDNTHRAEGRRDGAVPDPGTPAGVFCRTLGESGGPMGKMQGEGRGLSPSKHNWSFHRPLDGASMRPLRLQSKAAQDTD